MTYFHHRRACSISRVDDVIITGGGVTRKVNRKIVSRYNKNGWVEDLPSLRVGRGGHGCAQFLSGGDKVRLTI